MLSASYGPWESGSVPTPASPAPLASRDPRRGNSDQLGPAASSPVMGLGVGPDKNRARAWTRGTSNTFL